MIRLGLMAVAVAMSIVGSLAHAKMAMQTFAVLAGAGPHDVYPVPDGTVWFTARGIIAGYAADMIRLGALRCSRTEVRMTLRWREMDSNS
jgi:hypothetical protein